jgi:hypothetical protein
MALESAIEEHTSATSSPSSSQRLSSKQRNLHYHFIGSEKPSPLTRTTTTNATTTTTTTTTTARDNSEGRGRTDMSTSIEQAYINAQFHDIDNDLAQFGLLDDFHDDLLELDQLEQLDDLYVILLYARTCVDANCGSGVEFENGDDVDDLATLDALLSADDDFDDNNYADNDNNDNEPDPFDSLRN